MVVSINPTLVLRSHVLLACPPLTPSTLACVDGGCTPYLVKNERSRLSEMGHCLNYLLLAVRHVLNRGFGITVPRNDASPSLSCLGSAIILLLTSPSVYHHIRQQPPHRHGISPTSSSHSEAAIIIILLYGMKAAYDMIPSQFHGNTMTSPCHVSNHDVHSY